MTATILRFPTKRRPATKRRRSATPRPPDAETVEWHRAFGQRLARVRAIFGVSEAEAASIFRITVRTYRRREAGGIFHGGQYELKLFVEKYRLDWWWILGSKKGSEPRCPPRLATADGQRVLP
jgi:hypothetical protein